MAISAEPSTFEFTRDWLVSSDAFVRDAMGAESLALDDSRDEARARIHREEAYDEPNSEEETEDEPDPPPSVNARPRAIIITRGDTRKRVGTGTWSGEGQLLVCMEVPIPAEYLLNHADGTPTQNAAKFANAQEWAADLCKRIRDELLETSGQGDQNGTPYLNAVNVDIFVPPSYPEDGEPADYMAWIYEVTWK